MTRWRKRVLEAGMEKLLEETINAGLDIGDTIIKVKQWCMLQGEERGN